VSTPSDADTVLGGPSVVAIGGGHGLAATLRAVSHYTDRVTAIVSVADDGGSSGRLRELLHIIPPGDLRKCLVALAEPGSLLASTFEYRFSGEDLGGHALGNLILAGLIDETGDPVTALEEAGRLLGVKGRVLPSTVEPVVLKAEADCGHVAGQVAVMATDNIRKVSLVPSDPEAPAQAVAALEGADQIILGPGSLFTSVSIGPFEIEYMQLFVIVTTVILMIGLTIFIARTQVGRAMRATSFDLEAASMMGIDVDRVIVVTFLIGSALAGAAGVMNGLIFQNVDPYVGFRGRYNFCEKFYFLAKADIGGFGVGSDLTWEASAALGCQLTKNIFAEAGYRYLAVDYHQGGQNGLTYDVRTQGAEVTLGINF